MGKGYANEKSIQIMIALLKKHAIKKIIASPGTTNFSFVNSVQNDDYFEIYSSVDERSAGYIACGLAEESGEPVVLSCTGATASRNYNSALTEAYYRKLPILALTSTQPEVKIGHNVAQVIDRRELINDTYRVSVQIPIIHDSEEEWGYTSKMNEALLALRRNGGGPAHINLTTSYSHDYKTDKLPDVQFVERVTINDELPSLDNKKVAVFVGAHSKWDEKLTEAVEKFCEKYNAVVIGDRTSNYQGEYGVMASLVTSQDQYYAKCRKMDVLIHIGNVSGAYINLSPTQVWRVNPDGDVVDTFKKLRYTFDMEEMNFFEMYNEKSNGEISDCTYYKEWKNEYDNLINQMPELPFSNVWVARKIIDKLPDNSILHLGILNSLRSWNFFETDKKLFGYSNTGGFGIDGCTSSLIGASLANKDKAHYGVIGDLSFFYDMNSLGNRHVPGNIRLIVVNNGIGTEFKNYNHHAAALGESADNYIAARGHFGNKSKELLKNYAENLGFTYMSASNKEEFEQQIEEFLDESNLDKSIIFELFTNSEDESEALRTIKNIEKDAGTTAKNMARNILGEKGKQVIKNIIKK